MKRTSDSSPCPVRRGERGQSLVMAAILLTALLGMAALVVDIGYAYFSYQELVAATNAAALAGGAAIPAGNAVAVATDYSAKSGQLNNHFNLQNVSVSATLTCVSTSSYPSMGLPPCATYGSQLNANVIQVKASATVPTFFAKIFGVTSIPMSAAATASAKGGGAPPYHVMMVLDTTASMGQGSDTGCISGGSGGATSLTPEQCAQEGIQTLLSELDPCPTTESTCGTATGGVYPNSVDEVGLMVFPGICSSTATKVTTANCPAATSLTDTIANSTYAPNDYGCPTTAPPIASYNNNPEYLVLPLQSNYRTSDIAGLNFGTSGSNLVNSVGATTDGSCTGVTTPGGEGTFYAGAIKAAQDYLVANSTTGVENIIILLSDGDATATGSGSTKGSEMFGSVTSYSATAECQQAVTAATNAKNAGIQIYSVSYGTETSGCTAGDTLTPCGTMSGISSLPLSQYFFSVPQTKAGKTSTVCSGAVPITQLSQVFTTIAGDLTSSRLIPNSAY